MKPISLKHRLRYSFLLLASLTLLPTTESQAQERKEEIRLEVTQKPLSQVFRQLEKSTGYKFMFSHDDVKGLQVTRKVQAGDIEQTGVSAVGVTAGFAAVVSAIGAAVMKTFGRRK